MPPLDYIYPVAAVTGDPIAAKIARGEELRVGIDTRKVLYHLMEADVAVPGFRHAFQSGGYRVYERIASLERSAASGRRARQSLFEHVDLRAQPPHFVAQRVHERIASQLLEACRRPGMPVRHGVEIEVDGHGPRGPAARDRHRDRAEGGR